MNPNLEQWAYGTMASVDVTWYRKHGRYPNRVVRDSAGVEYVIGDWSWARQFPARHETIDDKLHTNHGAVALSESTRRHG